MQLQWAFAHPGVTTVSATVSVLLIYHTAELIQGHKLNWLSLPQEHTEHLPNA